VLFGIASNVVLLPLLSMALLIAYMNKREYMKKSGFDKPEVGIIIVGSLFGLFVDIPLIITGDSLLNINLGGALIPVIVCGSLIYKKDLNLPLIGGGTAVVSVLAYLVTRIEPDVGIVAEFPWFLVPSFAALIIALVLGLFNDEKEFFTIPYAYTIAVLGNLIGADLLRIPELIRIGILGSFGGAGAMDLVYLSGLIASVPLVFFYYRRHPITPSEDVLDIARQDLHAGRYAQVRDLSLKSVVEELKKAYKLLKMQGLYIRQNPVSNAFVLQKLGFQQYAVDDFLTLSMKKEELDFEEASKDYLTGKLLRDKVRERVNEIYSSLFRRIGAYIIDSIILIIPFVLFIFLIILERNIAGTASLTTTPVMLAVISLGTSIQFLYFTILEWYFGTTIGKKLFGLRVVDEDIGKMSFIQSAARNSGRYADMLLGFYIISIALISRSPSRKRIGDYIAGTRVVKIK